ncbi:major facilitator superfamily domain-containing protein [Fusarium sp. MPI-SDFR-AT-0072]|uniref:Major facilitator-type transporter psiT1 n=1 Tax=Fusarium oxysporum f. sp. rapae TaxID=485398 RepID=A0A8J5NJC1_FUSOX|nr:Major facilitator-type transporter psiT1 [Fusarium oxysporum f. sp. rapae]KAH7147582.1 major facilitator superfamily domain-containing protein [Fusarium sp. MPI-SDFR-AT-0072]
MASDETTPLLPQKGERKGRVRNWLSRAFNVENRILLAGFLITLSFSFTQVPLFYVFHLMTCDSFYETHPPYDGPGDRCSRDEIAAGTATQYSILGMSTTFCGTLNLFVAGWTSKKFGPRAALLCQILIPAARVVTQILGVVAGGEKGMIIIQATQLITILGGPAGYILVVNVIAGEVVEPIRRTAVFGQLQGAIMLGQAIGYLSGGMIGDAIDIRAPFDVAFISFILAGIYVWCALPYISPDSMSNGGKNGQKGVSGFLAPLRILTPQRLRLADGRVKKHFGVIFLCSGIFVSVLATGYAPLLIQMYATAAFNFSQGDNGWLMSEFAFMRSFFLILLFPRIIAWGRGRVIRSDPNSDDEAEPRHIPTEAGEFDATLGEQADHEPYEAVSRNKEDEGCLFDLVFLRWSLLVDGLLTTVAAFATKPWHIYLAAFLLPFGSGSAPAAKGVITQMCPDSQRADALNAVTLVENVARLATQGLFGFIFASLAEVGKAYATFFCNAAIALLAMGVLLFSNFPPPGSTLIEKHEEQDEVQNEASEGEPLLNDRD